MLYRLGKVLNYMKVGHVEPATLRAHAIEREFGINKSYDEEEMLEYISQAAVRYGKFEQFIVQPAGGRIIGIFQHPIKNKVIFRVIGFINPKGLEKKYKEKLAEKGRPETKPYWEFYGLGDEWEGTGVTRGDGILTLSITKSKSEDFPVMQTF